MAGNLRSAKFGNVDRACGCFEVESGGINRIAIHPL